MLEKHPCQVILSGYPSVLYDEWLAELHSLELQVRNRGGVRTAPFAAVAILVPHSYGRFMEDLLWEAIRRKEQIVAIDTQLTRASKRVER